jgi:hypothetical protein
VTCGGGHRTANCEENDPHKFKCMNCKAAGHTSWDRTCPVFRSACTAAEKSDPEHTDKYFPNDDPWTWEQQNTEDEAESTDNLLNRTNTREGRTRRTEEPPHCNGQQESSRSCKRQQEGPENHQCRGRERSKRRESVGGGRRAANPQIGHRDRGWQEREPGETRQSRLEDYGLGISQERGSAREGNDNNNSPHQG